MCVGDAATGQHQIHCAKHMQSEQVMRRSKTFSRWMRHCSEASLQGSIHLPVNNFCRAAFLGW